MSLKKNRDVKKNRNTTSGREYRCAVFFMVYLIQLTRNLREISTCDFCERASMNTFELPSSLLAFFSFLPFQGLYVKAMFVQEK